MPVVSGLRGLYAMADEQRERDMERYRNDPNVSYWQDYFSKPKPEAKQMNDEIYYCRFAAPCRSPAAQDFEARKLARIRELFGVKMFLERSIREFDREYIGEVLVDDAIRNHTREFLPDALLPLYDKKISEYTFSES